MYPIDILEIYRAKSLPKFDMETKNEVRPSCYDTAFKIKKIYPKPFDSNELTKKPEKHGLYYCPFCKDEAAFSYRAVTSTTLISSMRTHLTRQHPNLVKTIRGNKRTYRTERKEEADLKEKEILYNTNDSNYT